VNTNLHKSREELDLVKHYAKAWTLLQKYDDKTLCIYTNLAGENFTLGYDEATLAINDLKESLIQKAKRRKFSQRKRRENLKGYSKISIKPSADASCYLLRKKRRQI